MAEHIKLESTVSDKVTYKDIMSIEHTIPSSEVWDVVSSVVEKITTEVASKIKRVKWWKYSKCTLRSRRWR